MLQRNYDAHRRGQAAAKRRRRRQRIRRIKQVAACVAAVVLICAGMSLIGTGKIQNMWNGQKKPNAVQAEQFLENQQKNGIEEYPQELMEMLEKNPETYDFVTSYPQRSKYQGKTIDLTGEVKSGEVPLFLQWDRRWGYDSYGNEMIAVAGCGPTCMSMAYAYLTKDTDMNPREIAEFAHENGYDTDAGTSWSFFTDGASQLGLEGEEIGLDETKMKEVLDAEKVIICSMRPGDFTTTGHFILIRGYDKSGFWVNDPNSRENSDKHWTFDTISTKLVNT